MTISVVFALPCWLALFSGIVECLATESHLRILGTSILGQDPQTVNRLNGESFQQDVLVTYNGYQYAVFYVADPLNASIRHPSISRRALSDITGRNEWDTFTFMDYNQTDDDGHDTISLGVSKGDGTLHMGFDQHDNLLNYRVSVAGVATDPSNVTWSAKLFGPILDYLPGLGSLDKSIYFVNVTYPRFLSIPDATQSGTDGHGHDDLLFEMRVGRSGLGDDWLYAYTPRIGWRLIGKYLEGVNNNAYINGMDFDRTGGLHVTWTYRDYVNDTGQDVAVEAGPNGPENNHDMVYAWSSDLGSSWYNTWGQLVANVSPCTQEPIVPVSAGITVFSIPKYGGILNQESQTVDAQGRIHVLNRENTTGTEMWYHYWRSTSGHWTRTPFPPPSQLPGSHNISGTPTPLGKRGKLVAPPSADPDDAMLLALLPSNLATSSALVILKSTVRGHFRDWTVVWEGDGCGWEPLFDRELLTQSGGKVLSVFLVNGTQLEVVDFDLRDL